MIIKRLHLVGIMAISINKCKRLHLLGLVVSISECKRLHPLPEVKEYGS